MKKSKKILGISAGVALALGLLVGGGSPAYAGTCSKITHSNGSLTATCVGQTTIKWKCSTDLWNTVNKKTIPFGASGGKVTFKACDAGFPYEISVS